MQPGETPLKPTGFWSYTSSDDNAARGRLSQLRRLLADELQLKLGGRARTVHIFQDVAAIPFGTDWLKEIRQALAESSFLIPIVTPAFLQSEMCCQEVMWFHEHEAAAGRDDLIFPFHYVNVDDLGRGEVHDPAVLDLLRSRQRIDFRALRLKDPTGEEVASKLETLADAIRAALRRGMRPATPDPATTAPTTPARGTQAARPGPAAPPVVPIAPPALVLPVPPQPARRSVTEPETVLIPPGSFIMGIPPEETRREKAPKEYDDHARPQHKVTIARGFCLGKYPVTRGEFAAFVQSSGYAKAGADWRNPGFAQDDRHPVVGVSFEDADAYVSWLSRETGQTFQLPSEAEWEYAARAGTTTARYWGDGWGEASTYACTGTSGTAPVGSRKPNGFGLYDMLGNVWEGVADPWHDDYRGAPSDGSVWTTGGSSGRRVLRGGSWDGNPWLLRAGARSGFGSGGRGGLSGFRLARTL